MTDKGVNDDGTAVNPPLPDSGPTDGTHGEGVQHGEGVDESPGAHEPDHPAK
jgi:hypothetical protein